MNVVGNVKVKRSPNLVMYFEGNRVVLENYNTQERYSTNALGAGLLGELEEPKSIKQITRAFAEYAPSTVANVAERMMRIGLLVTEDSAESSLGKKLQEHEAQWPLASKYFHFSTKAKEFLITQESSKDYYNRYLKGKIQPPIYKEYQDNKRIPLSDADSSNNALFDEVLRTRKTIRDFEDGPITFSQLSSIIRLTWGRVSYYKTKEFGLLLHKTSPSAGARHPTEVYPIINNVKGVERGIYHYNVKQNALELLRKGDFRRECTRYCAGQEWAGDSAALFSMTSIVSRTTWKYRVPRTYRSLLLDVGHLSQTFYLVCTSRGLGPFCTGVMCDKLIEKELGLDGINETILFVVGVGVPKSPQPKPA